MKKYVTLALGALAALTATSANAAQFLTITGPSGNFGDDEVTCVTAAPCAFTRTFTFTGASVAPFNAAGMTITSGPANSGMANIDFTSVSLNGVLFTPVTTGIFEFQTLNTIGLLAGINTILVNGTTGGNASFAGNINLTAVPEPGTWALMLVGFGAVGYAMRRRSASLIPQAV